MSTAKRIKQHRKLRDEEIQKKLSECLTFIEKDRIKEALFARVLNKYRPQASKITKKAIDSIEKNVQSTVEDGIEKLLRSKITKILRDEIKEMINDELDDRFRELLRYPNEY